MDDRTGTDAAAAEAGGRARTAAPRRESSIPAADRLKAIGLMCLAVGLFSGPRHLGEVSRHPAHLPIVQIVWARFLGQFLIMLSLLSALPLSALLRTRQLKFELLRSFLMVSTTACNFLALRHLRLDQTDSVASWRRSWSRCWPDRSSASGSAGGASSPSSSASSACSSSCIPASAALHPAFASPSAACSPMPCSCC